MQDIYKKIAKKAALEAGAILLKYYGKNPRFKTKSDSSFVSQADIASTKAIRRIISSTFPDHTIICEEFGQTKKRSDYRWIIDPLDGTHNFLMQIPLYGVSIALEHKKTIILGVIYLPSLDKMYIAVKGNGATCNNKPIKVNNVKTLHGSNFIFDAKLNRRSNMKLKLLKKISQITKKSARIFGVSVYNNMLIAEGMASINIDFDSHIWDHSAALLIIEESGGKVTDLKGNSWSPEIKHFIATNGLLHDKILKLINTV
ncbi:MAG: inositol monophosphatase [Nanoarchaeota archaeon]